MKRFVLRENIKHFGALLAEAGHDEFERRRLQVLLAEAQRDLALLNTAAEGASLAHMLSPSLRGPFSRDQRAVCQFRNQFEGSPQAYMLIDPRPGLHVIDANQSLLDVTLTRSEELVGKPVFETFPDNPDDPMADGISNAYASLKIASQTGQPHAQPVHRYDIRDENGDFVETYWRALDTPIHDENGQLLYILNCLEDVTSQVAASDRRSK